MRINLILMNTRIGRIHYIEEAEKIRTSGWERLSENVMRFVLGRRWAG